MNSSLDHATTRRVRARYLDIAPPGPPLSAADRPYGALAWVGCHGGTGVSTLAATTGIGRDGGTVWPDAGDGEVPVVLVCRASASGSAAGAAAIEQWQQVPALVHVRLVGLVVVAAGPKRAPAPVRARLKLIAGWVPRQWFVGWQNAYLAADDPRMVGPTPHIGRLRAHLCGLLEGRLS